MDYYITLPLFFGDIAVAVFIAISGFALSDQAFRARSFSAAGFYVRRLWRIAPPYYAGLLLSGLLIATVIGNKTGSHWDGFNTVRPFDWLAHVLFFHNLTANGSMAINGAYWSIGVEMQYYLLFPLFVLAFRLPFRIWATMGGVLAIVSVRLTQAVPNFNPHLFLSF